MATAEYVARAGLEFALIVRQPSSLESLMLRNSAVDLIERSFRSLTCAPTNCRISEL